MRTNHKRLAAELAAYQVEEELGRDARGIVLAGRHRQLGHQVTIKQLAPGLAADPVIRARFVAQARALAALDHPHVVSIYDLIERDGLCLLVMERLTGGTLWDRFTTGTLGAEAACAAILAACVGLEYAHRHGVFHGDLNPANLAFTAGGVLKVADLGMAQVISESSDEEIGPATDVYAIATVLAHLFDVAGTVPAGVADVAMNALRPNPQERYSSAEAFGVALAQAAGAAWGSGWLAKAELPVAASGPILTAALQDPGPSQGSLWDFGPPGPPGPPREPVDCRLPGDQDESTRSTCQLQTPRGLAALLVVAALAVIGVALLTRPTSAPALGAGAGALPAARPEQTPVRRLVGPAWRVLRDAPIARQQAAVAVQDGVIWVFGGLEGDHVTTKTEGYDPPLDAWKAGPELPIPLHHAMAVSYQGELVVIGGWQPEASNLTAIPSNRVFALRNGGWVELPKLNRPRAAAAAAVVDDRIVVVGGQANGELVGTTEVFDGTRWIDAATIPTPREHLAAASYGRFVYAVGGRALSSDRNSAALERYDPAADRWEDLPPMPTARGSLGVAIVDGRLIAVGGEQPTGVFGTVQAYDIASSTWSELAPLRTARHGLAAAAVGMSLYAINGADRPTYAESSATMEVLTVPHRRP